MSKLNLWFVMVGKNSTTIKEVNFNDRLEKGRSDVKANSCIISFIYNEKSDQNKTRFIAKLSISITDRFPGT